MDKGSVRRSLTSYGHLDPYIYKDEEGKKMNGRRPEYLPHCALLRNIGVRLWVLSFNQFCKESDESLIVLARTTLIHAYLPVF